MKTTFGFACTQCTLGAKQKKQQGFTTKTFGTTFKCRNISMKNLINRLEL